MSKSWLTFFKNTPSQSLLKKSEELAILAFQRATEGVPTYKRLLQERDINPAEVKDIDTFKELVPIIDKKTTFIAYQDRIKELGINGDLEDVASILTSSGHSGSFSFGLITNKDLKEIGKLIDSTLDYHIGIAGKKTVLINCLPMGVRFPTKECVVAEVSVRSDMALALVRGFGRDFDQIIFVGENSFMKEVLEEGLEQGINWSSLDVCIIVGEEDFPENYREYIAYLLGKDLDKVDKIIVASSMGISEIGLSVFQESKDTIRIRRQAQRNSNLRYALFGEDIEICPMLFHFYPTRTYVEEEPASYDGEMKDYDLVITNLDLQAKLPLIRYNTKDRGRIILYDKLAEILNRYKLQELLPELKLPLVAVSGRGKKIRHGDINLYPEQIKAAIYSDFELARATTANFKMKKKDSQVVIEMQLKKGTEKKGELQAKFSEAIFKYTGVQLEVILYPYHQFPYPLDYERKFRYID